MTLSSDELAYLADNHSAAMITVGPGGFPRPVRVGVALVDGRLWCSGTERRVRTPRLRRDPRCSLFVFDQHGFSWLALETTVTVLDGPEVPVQSVRLFRIMQNRPTGPLLWYGGELDDDAFAARMIEEQRIIYEFEVRHSYGLDAAP